MYMINKKQLLFNVLIFLVVTNILFFVCCIRDKGPLSLSDDTDSNLPIIPTFHIDPKYNCDYWSIPTEDAFILFFQLYRTIKADSLFAGAIQYRLNQARTIDDKLNNIFPGSDWQLGVLHVGVSEELYNSFDSTTNRFGNASLDYLLEEFNLIRCVKRGMNRGINRKYVKLYFNDDYNVSVLGDIFATIKGVRWAGPNGYGSLPEASHSGAILKIEEELFNFNFYQSNWQANNTHNWEIHVIDNKVTLIAEWDENIY